MPQITQARRQAPERHIRDGLQVTVAPAASPGLRGSGSAIGLAMLGGAGAGIASASGQGGQGDGCPKGGDWFLIFAVGDEFHWDNNGDGLLCSRIISGQGHGNSPFANKWLVKDNNNPS